MQKNRARNWWKPALCGVSMLLGAALPTHAADVFNNGRSGDELVVLKLTQNPCTDQKVLAHLVPQYHAELRAAVLTYRGKQWSSCYIERGGYVHSIDEEGAPLQPIPRRAFLSEHPA